MVQSGVPYLTMDDTLSQTGPAKDVHRALEMILITVHLCSIVTVKIQAARHQMPFIFTEG